MIKIVSRLYDSHFHLFYYVFLFLFQIDLLKLFIYDIRRLIGSYAFTS